MTTTTTKHQVHKTHLCSHCHEAGHNVRTCKSRKLALEIQDRCKGEPQILAMGETYEDSDPRHALPLHAQSKSSVVYGGQVDEVLVATSVPPSEEVQECLAETRMMMMGF